VNYDESLIQIAIDALIITMKIMAPILAAGIVVGLVISILQSITSIQEQTLSFVPKIFAMVAVAVLLIPWIMMRLIEFTAEMFTNW
jgi:flagellar biosynthetic protein FliQ